MVNIIIYEDNIETQSLYQKIIHSFFKERKQKIKFYIFDHYIKDLETKLCLIPGKKIFILDVEVPGKSGLDLAKSIRNHGDWISPLIVITSYEYLKNTSYTSKVLMLDFISKREQIEKRLLETLETVSNMIEPNHSYTFQYNGKLFHIPYDEILYFEKDLNENYTFLYTKETSYQIKESIIQINKNLEYHPSFFKTHRSCIVNINNIKYLDDKNNTIYLGKYSTQLLTKEKKEILKRELKKINILVK